MAATPPMQTTIHTPPTPLHGARHDSYQPYSTRKSTRHSTRQNQRSNQTPPPQFSNSKSQFSSVPISKSGAAFRHQVAHTYSPPSSTHSSPENKSFENNKPKKSKKSSSIKTLVLPSNSMVHQPFQDPKTCLASELPGTNTGTNMLPTPAKTPRKKPIPSPAIVPTARVLFPVQMETDEGTIPVSRKKGRKKRHVGFSLDSSMEDDDNCQDNNIQIFTDSTDKVPELDPSEDNPFYDNSDRTNHIQESPEIKSVRKRKVKPNANGNKEVEEAFKREEGMVYVFRGKKVYRKFADDLDAEEHDSLTTAGDINGSDTESTPRLRPLTRSSVRPRLLFPTKNQIHERPSIDKEEEEATTDIEESQLAPNDSEMTDLAPDTDEEILVTPAKPSFTTPATPPMTGYATRAATKKVLDSSSPIGPEPVELSGPSQRKLSKKLGHSDGWLRPRVAKKRGSEALGKDIEGNKRVKESHPQG